MNESDAQKYLTPHKLTIKFETGVKSGGFAGAAAIIKCQLFFRNFFDGRGIVLIF